MSLAISSSEVLGQGDRLLSSWLSYDQLAHTGQLNDGANFRRAGQQSAIGRDVTFAGVTQGMSAKSTTLIILSRYIKMVLLEAR